MNEITREFLLDLQELLIKYDAEFEVMIGDYYGSTIDVNLMSDFIEFGRCIDVDRIEEKLREGA